MLKPVAAIARLTFIEALRNRLLGLIIGTLIILFALAEFTGALAITEAGEIQAVLLASLLRLFAVFVVSLFVITSMVREFNDKGLELVLSLPVPRASYFLGKFAGFALLSLIFALLCGLLLLLYAAPPVVLVWGLSLFCELLLMVALSLLCLFTFNQVLPAMTVVAVFYVLARSIAAIQLIATNPLANPELLSQDFITGLLKVIAFLIPELERFTNAEWLLGTTPQWSVLGPVFGQTLVYIVLLSGVALFDLYRKEL